MGRRPDLPEVKEAKGNPGRRPIVRAPEALPALAELPPKGLRGRALNVWKALAPELARLKFLRETDRHAFERYCLHFAVWWQLTEQLKAGRLTYETESLHGKMRRIAPEFIVRDRVEKRMIELEDRFGLSPQARQQLLQRMISAAPTLPFDDPNKAEAARGPAPEAERPSLESPVGFLGRPN